ncbi:MAG: hypothetical protein ACE5JH_07815 [Acidobacteriota bacterium]
MDAAPRRTGAGPARAPAAGADLSRGAAGGGAPRLGRFFGRRRNLIVDPGYQVRTALAAALGVTLLLGLAAALFHLLAGDRARPLWRDGPGPARFGTGADGRTILLLVAAGIVLVAAVFVIEILETHKTAGVIYKVTRGLREIETGLWGAALTLRKHDNFKEMEEAFNAAARSLRARLDGDLRTLRALEEQIGLAGRELESGNREGASLLLRRAAGDARALRERREELLRSSRNGSHARRI